MLKPDARAVLEKHGYRMVGRHSAVKLCHWVRERLLRGRACYKAKFYGIESHRCVQLTPSVAWCQHRCAFCWRPVEHTQGAELSGEVDEPGSIAKGAIEAQRALLSGYGGESRVSRRDFLEALEPRHAAISLAGEPTSYPLLPELVQEFHRMGMSTFVVSNGMNPGVMERLRPTQMYLSLPAPTPEVYRALVRPVVRDGWERLMQSLEVLSEMRSRCRTAVRITLVRGYNFLPERYAELVEVAEPQFVEAKSYMHVGYSRRRLSRERMPLYREVREFALALAEATGYRVKDASEESRVVLLSR